MYIFQRPENGTWYVEFSAGKRRSLKTKNKEVAEQQLNAIKRQTLSGKLSALNNKIKSTTLLSDQLNAYLAETTLADKSREAYACAVRNFVKDCGDLPVAKIDYKTLVIFSKKRRQGGAGEVSVNSYLRHLRVLLNYSRSEKVIDDVPKFPFEKLKKKHPDILSKDQYELLLLHAKHCDPEMYRYITFALWTGVRRGGLWRLKWEKVYENHCVVILKGNTEHTVPLLAEAKDAMGKRGSGYVFRHYPDIDKVTKKFKRLARDCELDAYHFHHLRHTAATLMLASGIQLHYVQKMLGHTDIKTTQIYAKILQSRLTQEMQKFNLDANYL